MTRPFRILVTGASGFLGRHVVARLRQNSHDVVPAPRSNECDLTAAGAVADLLRASRPECIYHLAARVGGIGANQQNPGAYFHDNLLMGLNVLEQSRQHGVQKVILVGTICSYPKHAPIPFQEAELWNGYPEETNAPYGVAKKALFVMADAYQRQYGLSTICLLPVNLYGPHDNFDLDTSHVIPAMIRKFSEAIEQGRSEVVLWGDGSPTREFLYVDDCAEGLVLAGERYDSTEPVNLGAGFEVSIAELASRIAQLLGFTGRIVWDRSRPNGQPRRMLDTSRARERFGFTARTSLEEGLMRTIRWYRETQTTTKGPRA